MAYSINQIGKPKIIVRPRQQITERDTIKAVKLYLKGYKERDIELLTGIKSAYTYFTKLRRKGANIPKRYEDRKDWSEIINKINKL